jgi:hypothetical protein
MTSDTKACTHGIKVGFGVDVEGVVGLSMPK